MDLELLRFFRWYDPVIGMALAILLYGLWIWIFRLAFWLAGRIERGLQTIAEFVTVTMLEWLKGLTIILACVFSGRFRKTISSWDQE